ncbi:MAG: cupin domain-containing protein [Proteobacteria bacterium]|nr:cupin domain-containing protein [Pseudomonadota bacterium]
MEQLAAANLHPLWDRFRTLTPVRPQAKDPPLVWRWADIEPFAGRAVAQVPIDDVERRALILVNPAFGGETVTTNHLIGAFTILDPGDRARPHRHTFAAIRFATNAEGAATIVNGRRCEMREGDLILTPPMCWHGHINDSDRRVTWFDAANIPLIRALDANFFEPGDPSANEFWQVEDGEEKLWREAGMIGMDAPRLPAHSPKYHYSGAAMRRLLAALPPGRDGARTARYVNPVTGDAVMPALDCYAMRLTKGQPMRPRRTTCNMICLVTRGKGRSSVGEHSFDWSQHDVFSIPHWNFASHQAHEADADLFIVSDRVAYERLDLLREEFQ